MDSLATTISCRFIAQALAVVACIPDGSAALAQTRGRSHFLPLAPRWSVELGAPPALPPIIAGSIVAVALHDGGVVAYRTADSRVAWRVETPPGPVIAADDERIYIASKDAVHAVVSATGEQAWRVEAGMLTAPPLVHGGWVVVATVATVTALRAADGSIVWRREIGTIESQPAIDGDVLFLSLLEGSVLALNLQNGEPRWERPLGGAPSEPTAIAAKVYVPARDKRFYVLDADNGEVEWSYRIGAAPRGRAAVDEDNVYVVALDNMLRAFDRGNGALKWTKKLAYRPQSGPTGFGTAIVVPGATMALPVLGRDGAVLTEMKFSSRLVALSNVVAGPFDYPMVALVTGDLEHPWTLWLMESSLDPPPLAIAELTSLPGQTIEIALPQ